MSMHAAGWNLGRGGRSLWRGALVALVALVGLGTWASTRRGGDAGSPIAAQPAPVRTALVFAKPIGSPTSPFGHGPETIYLASATGKNPLRLARGADPALSPDGRWVVYRRDTKAEPDRLLIIGTGGGTARQLPASSDEPVVWSPDSRLVAASGSSTGHLAVVNVRSGKAIVLRVPQASYGFSFAPDSTELAFTHSTGSGQNVYTVSTSGRAVRRLTDDGRSSAPLWGPTGIAFGRQGDVWLMDEGGGGVHQLTHTRAGIYPAAWSSNGARLLAAYPATHNGKLYAVDASTGAAHDLTGFVGDLYAQGLSRDGTTILAAIGCGGTASPIGHVETIPFAGGRPTVIARGPCRASWNA
jgi:Tol biopolymer transport system component